MPTTSYWTASASIPSFPQLTDDLAVDVAVIGGGSTGVTAAYLMKRAGLRVALLERGRCATADTAHTSAHLTQVTDTRLGDLVASFGRDHAQAAWDAGAAAIDRIEEIVREERIPCHFQRVPGFLHASILHDRNERDGLRAEAELAAELGFPAHYVNCAPVFDRPAVRFANQARIHPLRYLATLLKRVPGGNCHVFEHTDVTGFSESPLCIEANGHKVTCEFVVIATDVPLAGNSGTASSMLLQTRLAPYTSYAIGGRLPAGRIADALFWDTSDPYFYLRMEKRGLDDYAIFGGADHRTGQAVDPRDCFVRLIEILRRFFPEVDIDHRWSGQVLESTDGLPLIGETAPGQFVATGFGGNGLTFGTLAAMMALDWVTGRKNPWRELFDVHRKDLAGLWNYVVENKDYPYYMIKDRIGGASTSGANVGRGQGEVLRLDGKLTAAYRDDRGTLTMLSAVCPHMGCIVHWNNAEKTWDCPCHGSRFEATGAVLAGPAESPLELADVDQPRAASMRK